MAVRFKFRSSVDFDSVPIGEQPSISVGDLKSKVLLAKNLNICHGFDLKFSDAITGQEYVNEAFQIPSGSSVIIKRVPAGTTHKDVVQSSYFKEFQSQPTNIVVSSPPVNVDMNELDDFGVDFYFVPCDLDIDLRIQGDKRHVGTERFPEPFKGDFHKVEVSDPSEDKAGGLPHAGTEGSISEMKTKPKTKDYTKLEKVIKVNNPSLQKADLPPELKCSICDSFIKEAVMIPCCQHSFCERCIRLVLVQKGRCPECYSTKGTVEELLPNVSLRQATEHLLESQMLMTGSHNAFHQYAPNGESEAHVKDVSFNFTTHKKDTDLPQSPTLTETGSNEIMGESAHNLLFREKASSGCIEFLVNRLGAKPCEKRQILKEEHASACPRTMGACSSNLGKSQHINEEVEPISKDKRGLRVIAAAAGGDNRLMVARRNRKGNITSYMCGSPDHLIRECPATSSPNPMLKRGIAMLPRSMPDPLLPYWNATSFLHAGPFTNLYGNHAMTPFNFNTAFFPSGPCTNPTYMPTMYSTMPSFSDLMKMGGVASPLGPNRDHRVSGSAFLNIQNYDKSQKLSSDFTRRANSFDKGNGCRKRHLYKQTESSHQHKCCLTKEKIVSTSHYRHPQQRKRKHDYHNLVDNETLSVDDTNYHSLNGNRCWRSCQNPDQTSSEVENFPCSSCCGSEERDKHHHRRSNKETERERDMMLDIKRGHYKRYRHSESDPEESFLPDKIRKQKLNTHDFGYFKPRVKSDDDDLGQSRWRMRSGSDDNDEGYHHYYKWKRAH